MPHEPQQVSGTPLSSPVEPPLLRFDLRQLLWFVAIVSGLLTVIVSLPGLVAVALSLAVLVVAAHLFSTAVATRLRAQTDDAQRLADRPNAAASATGTNDGEPSALAFRRSPWHCRGGTSLPWLPRLILGGIVSGAIIGALLLAVTIGHRTSPAGILVGSASLAVVGGWTAFVVGSFYGIFRHGLRDALTEQRKDEST